MSYLNSLCKPYQNFRVLLVADSKAIREPNFKTVGMLKINCTYCARFESVGFSTIKLLANLSSKAVQL